jgi:hypothetical protein
MGKPGHCGAASAAATVTVGEPFNWSARVYIKSGDGTTLSTVLVEDERGGFGYARGGIRLTDGEAAAVGRLLVDLILKRCRPATVRPERAPVPTPTDAIRARYSVGRPLHSYE